MHATCSPALMGWEIGVASGDDEGEGAAVVGGRVERVERLELVEGLEPCLGAGPGVFGDRACSYSGFVAAVKLNLNLTSFDTLPPLRPLPSSSEDGVSAGLRKLLSLGGGLAAAVALRLDLVMRSVGVSSAVLCEFVSAILLKALSAIVSISSAKVFLSSATNLYGFHLERCRPERVDE